MVDLLKLYTWRQSPGLRTCSDSAELDGQVMTYGYWQSVITPGNRAAACRGQCDCVLMESAEDEVETKNPYIVPGSEQLQGGMPPMQTNQDESVLKNASETIVGGSFGAVTPEKKGIKAGVLEN